jgi:threonylcarbamoyladenosine tRNA methylthiotransferase MtaB
VDGIDRVRLSSIEVNHVSDALLGAMAHPGVARHLHVPMQSGDDGVLAAMRRRYTAAAFLRAMGRARERVPGVNLTTDVIVGHPAEDDAAFERTLAFVDAAPITYAHVFPYSVRSGTTAAKLDGKVAPAVIRQRAERLRRLTMRKRTEFAGRFDGTTAEVLVENTRDPQTGELRGYTRNYLRAHLDGADGLMGTRVRAELRVAPSGRVGALAVAETAA